MRAAVMRLALFLGVVLAAGGCAVRASQALPDLRRRRRRAHAAAGAEAGHRAALRARAGPARLRLGVGRARWHGCAPRRGVDFVVFWWEPWGSVDRAARELDDVLSRALVSAPPSVKEIVIVAHSAGGLVAAHAVGRMPAPARKVTLVTIGAPFAGMHICPWSEVDIVHAPLMLGVSAVYHRYPPPPPGVQVIEYITSWPADPVMQPHWGTSPSRADVGPAGARRIEVDPRLDHNYVLDRVMDDLLPRR